jgi:hypothetical protein
MFQVPGYKQVLVVGKQAVGKPEQVLLRAQVPEQVQAVDKQEQELAQEPEQVVYKPALVQVVYIPPVEVAAEVVMQLVFRTQYTKQG